jgi:hypothetical protein
MKIGRPNDCLDSRDQLVPGMTIVLWSSLFGFDRYLVKCTPYKHSVDGEWFVQLVHEFCEAAFEYSLNELGITTEQPTRWVTTENVL